MEENQEIKAANLRVELQYLLQAIPERASELSQILKNTERANALYEQLLEKHKEVVKLTEAEKEVIANDRNTLQSQLNAHELYKIDWQTKVNEAKAQVKEANKELRWVNDKIFKGEEEVKNLEEKKLALSQEITQMVLLIAKYEALQVQVEELETKKHSILSEMQNAATDSDKKVSDAQAEFAKLEADTAAKVAEKNDAEYRLKVYTDQLYTHMNDYMVIKARIETHWQRTFPELELPLG